MDRILQPGDLAHAPHARTDTGSFFPMETPEHYDDRAYDVRSSRPRIHDTDVLLVICVCKRKLRPTVPRREDYSYYVLSSSGASGWVYDHWVEGL